MTWILGVDCSTNPKNCGLVLGELLATPSTIRVKILEATTANKKTPPQTVALDWLTGKSDVLLALDAPLGWPTALGQGLYVHEAGQRLQHCPDDLFFRTTDHCIKERLQKTPLAVGANLIARTAKWALDFLEDLRKERRKAIPIAWNHQEHANEWRSIEVYPAATRIYHGAPDKPGSLDGLGKYLDLTPIKKILPTLNIHERDAIVCALAGANFLRGCATAPNQNEELQARKEGWIWV